MRLRLLLILGILPLVSAQQPYVINTVAGIGVQPFAGGGGPAVNAQLILPQYLAADRAGNIFVTDVYYQQVFRISATGIITVYAGAGASSAAQLNNPLGIAADAAGNLFIVDNGNGRIRKVAPDGTVTTVSNTNGACLAVDTAGNLYISQTLGNIVRKVTPAGVVTAYAGTGQAGSIGDGGPATSAQLLNPAGLRLDAAGNLYVADTGNNKIRKITPAGIISTVAGSGKAGFAGDGQAAINASLLAPSDIVVGADGSLYIADNSNGRIRVVNPAGIISTFAGGKPAGAAGTLDGDGPVEQVLLHGPVALTMDSTGTLLVAVEGYRQVRRVTATQVTTIAGLPPTTEPSDNGPAAAAPLLGPYGVALDPAGAIYISDPSDHRIRKISSAGIITTFAGNGAPADSVDGAQATMVQSPSTLALDLAGDLYFTQGSILRRITTDGKVATLAGSTAGFAGDNSFANTALLSNATGIAVDPAGNIYLADTNNNRVRRIDAVSKLITTIAGTGSPTYGGDNGPAKSAALFHPNQLALDSGGNLFIADTGNQRIRKISPDGTIVTVAGNGGSGNAGEGGPATAAQLNTPGALAVDQAGNIFIGDMFGSRIRKVDASSGNIATIAGNGVQGYNGDGGFATSAEIDSPQTLAVDNAGNVYFADGRNQRLRKLSPAQLTPAGVLNAASLLKGPVAPGEIVVINVASAASPSADTTQVLFDGNAATIVTVVGTQVAVTVPYEVAGQPSTQLQLVVNGKNTNAIQLPVANTAPGIFTQDLSGAGPGMIQNADGSLNSPQNPATAGDTVTISATGEGQTNPPGVDGLAASDPAPMPVATVSAQIGGMDAPVISAGGVPGMIAGFFQVSVQIPAGVPTGDAVPIVLTVGAATSQPGVTMSIQ